jgi:hypothetical protein
MAKSLVTIWPIFWENFGQFFGTFWAIFGGKFWAIFGGKIWSIFWENFGRFFFSEMEACILRLKYHIEMKNEFR